MMIASLPADDGPTVPHLPLFLLDRIATVQHFGFLLGLITYGMSHGQALPACLLD